VVLSYLAKPVEAWQCGAEPFLCCLLGCACERIVLPPAEIIAADKTLPGADRVGKALDARVFVSLLFEEFRATLAALRERPRSCPGNWAMPGTGSSLQSSTALEAIATKAVIRRVRMSLPRRRAGLLLVSRIL